MIKIPAIHLDGIDAGLALGDLFAGAVNQDNGGSDDHAVEFEQVDAGGGLAFEVGEIAAEINHQLPHKETLPVFRVSQHWFDDFALQLFAKRAVVLGEHQQQGFASRRNFLSQLLQIICLLQAGCIHRHILESGPDFREIKCDTVFVQIKLTVLMRGVHDLDVASLVQGIDFSKLLFGIDDHVMRDAFSLIDVEFGGFVFCSR